MSMPVRGDIRNIAIIAHVDHGKTSLVDALLKQSHIFRANQQVGELIMDSNPLERERGITILAKNTAVTYKGVKINIIDTPGHADFSGEVERVINMADGCLLVVDAVDGPMPQTRYVLKKALEKGLKPVVVVNKMDLANARPQQAVSWVQDLFLELATDDSQLDFPVLYASARQGYAVADLKDERVDMGPLFEAIVQHVPPPSGSPDGPFQLLVASLTYNPHLGQIAVGRIFRGRIAPGQQVVRIAHDGVATPYRVAKVYVFQGLEQREVEEAAAGEIVSVAGVEDVAIGDTVADAAEPEALPPITIDEPTVQLTIGVNTSPFAGRENTTPSTSRQIRARLLRELQTNISLRVEDTGSADEFLVSGRGELHLAILIENMRREGYELQVSRPVAVTKVVDGRLMEPYEELTLDTREEFIGALTEDLSARLAQMTDMQADGQGNVRLIFRLPTRGLIGFNSFFVRATRGQGVMSTIFLGYEPVQGETRGTRNGVLVSSEGGVAVAYGLNNAQGRGMTFIEPGTAVYEGMIVGTNSRDDDININVCKEKKLTNIRAAGSDEAIRLTPPIRLSLEEALDFIAEDELVEVTPQSIRLRKKVLSGGERYRQVRDRVKTGT
jgi:GTP-binding protein